MGKQSGCSSNKRFITVNNHSRPGLGNCWGAFPCCPFGDKVLIWVQSAKITAVQTPGVSRKEDEQQATWWTSHITGRVAKPYKNWLQILFMQTTGKTHKVTLPFHHEPPMRLTHRTWSSFCQEKLFFFIHKITATFLWPEVLQESLTFSYILSLPFLIFY